MFCISKTVLLCVFLFVKILPVYKSKKIFQLLLRRKNFILEKAQLRKALEKGAERVTRE